jgi:hypothetical protein
MSEFLNLAKVGYETIENKKVDVNKVISAGTEAVDSFLDKVPIDKINNIGEELNLGSLTGGLNILNGVSNIIQGKDKNALDYVKEGVNIAKGVASLPGVKNIPFVGGGLGLAADTLDMVEMGKRHEKNPAYWFEKGISVASNAASFIPVVGSILQPIGQAGAFIFHELGDFFERETEKERKSRLKNEEVSRIIEEQIKRKKLEEQREKQRKEQLAHEERMRQLKKTVDYLEDTPLKNNLNGINFTNKNDFGEALKSYANLASEGKLKDVSVNDVNFMKGKLITDSFGNTQTLHDFVMKNPEGSIEEIKNTNISISDDPNFHKFKSNSQLLVRDKGFAEQQKWTEGNGGTLNQNELDKRMNNSSLSWDNSKEAVKMYTGGGSAVTDPVKISEINDMARGLAFSRQMIIPH